jgi:hypothetical protein
MKKIKLTQGKVTLVDDEDFKYLNQFKWCARKHRNTYYACRKSKYSNNRNMHRLIMNTPSYLQVDHIDHNGLNNQKSNLRNCTNSQNQMNMGSIYGSVKLRGVCKSNNKFRSYITFNNKTLYLGTFNTSKEAAIIYNEKAKELFGEYAPSFSYLK